MGQLAEALCFKPEGRGFRIPLLSLKLFIDIIIPAQL
jgi:hypothetical protein